MGSGDESREGTKSVDEVRWRGLNKVVDDSIHLNKCSIGSNGRTTDTPFEIDEKLLIDPRQLLVGSKIGEGAHGKVYKGRWLPLTAPLTHSEVLLNLRSTQDTLKKPSDGKIGRISRV